MRPTESTTDRSTPKSGKRFASTAVYALIALLGVLLVTGVRSQTAMSLEQARHNYRLESHDEAVHAVENVSSIFQQMYQGVRTIARLPGVRSIDRYAQNLGADSQTTVQEIYNNLYANVAISELYIVPVDIEPDEIDPNTGELQEPIITFDEFIVGRNADQETEAGEEHEELAEIEIYEYRLMKEQLAWMRERFPDESHVVGLRVPAISGPAVLTCDNSRYSPSNPIDRDRSGLVYAVPFYGTDGMLKGSIAAVVLIPVMRETLPTDEFAIRHVEHDVLFEPALEGQWSASRPYVDTAHPDPGLIYSETLPIRAVEGVGEWKLWVGFDDERFWSRSDVHAARRSEFVGYMIAALITLSLWTIAWLAMRHYRTMETFVQRLEDQVAQRTAELEHQTTQLKAEIAERIRSETERKELHRALMTASRQAGKAEVATGVLHNVGNSLNSVNIATDEAARRVRALPLGDLAEVSRLVDHHESDLVTFMTEDERGRLLPAFLREFSGHLGREQGLILEELQSLARFVDHINQVVRIQQKHARTTEVTETVKLIDIIEEALAISANSLERHLVEVRREFEAEPTITTDQHQLVQILVNLINNAKQAMTATHDRRITIRVERTDGDRVRVAFIDSGCGISDEQMPHLFEHGFTTREDGHGFGLHTSSLSAQQLGGSLLAHSDGPGRGATFVLELPLHRGDRAEIAA